MHSLGLKLTAEQIYSINNGSLKDAIVLFDGGCTGEIVSESGLLLTNHHCGFDAIQNHSTVEHNYLQDGFWARNYAEELPNRDMTVTFLVRIEDVSDKILAALSDTMSEKTRNEQDLHPCPIPYQRQPLPKPIIMPAWNRCSVEIAFIYLFMRIIPMYAW